MSAAVKGVRKSANYDYRTNEYDEVLEPDDDLRRAITIDELFDTVKEKIRKKYPSK